MVDPLVYTEKAEVRSLHGPYNKMLSRKSYIMATNYRYEMGQTECGENRTRRKGSLEDSISLYKELESTENKNLKDKTINLLPKK